MQMDVGSALQKTVVTEVPDHAFGKVELTIVDQRVVDVEVDGQVIVQTGHRDAGVGTWLQRSIGVTADCSGKHSTGMFFKIRGDVGPATRKTDAQGRTGTDYHRHSAGKSTIVAV